MLLFMISTEPGLGVEKGDIHHLARNLIFSADLENAGSKGSESRRNLPRRNSKIARNAHDAVAVSLRYLRVAAIAVRTPRGHQNHPAGHLECGAEPADPWNSRRAV